MENSKMIKNLISIVLVAAVILTIGFFLNRNKDNNDILEKTKFNAVVLENKKTSLLVKPNENEDELKSSDKISVIVPHDGAVLEDLSRFNVGSHIEITYDGKIMESYPAQIKAYEINLIDGDKSKEEINNDESDSKNDEKVNEYELTEEGIIKPESAKKAIEETTGELLKAISNKDFKLVSEYVHPEKGVRFTPYTNVSVDKDVVLDREKIEKFFENKNKYIWGYYDGRGDEISLTPSQYYDEFVYTADFINAEKIGYNEILSSGNMVENQFEVYKEAIVVEYYFSGFNPDYGGADWQSLRLVFEQYENEWKLVGIIHNQWTI